MKVVIFSQFFPPEMEPTGFMLHSFAKYLAEVKRYNRVSVVCGFSNFPTGRFFDKKPFQFFRAFQDGSVNVENVYVVPSDNKSNIKRIVNYTSYLFFALLRGLFLPRADIVVASSPPIFVGLAGLLVARFFKCRFVLDVRDIWPESAIQMGSLRMGSLAVRGLERLERLLYLKSDLITVATPGMVHEIKSKLPRDVTKKVEYVPCGVTIPSDSELRPDGPNPFALPDRDKFCVLYAGLHGHAQNLSTVVEAANILKERDDIVFYLIGDGPDKERVIKVAEDFGIQNIRFLPPVTRDSIRRYYLQAGCALVPLRDLEVFKTVFPSKTFELMSYGVPTVVGVGGQIADIIKQTGSGIAVQPECADEYAAAIIKIADNPDLRDQLRGCALATARTQFDYDIVNARFEAYLKALKGVGE